jgi:alginate O-acetyltransferase complex protein AlgI
MAFTSLNFLLFFPAVLVIYYLLPQKYRWIFLLVVSYYFYLNIKPVYVLLLGGVTVTTYFFAILIDRAKKEEIKKRLLILDIIITLIPLLFFKYYYLVNHTVFSLMEQYGLRWPLPDISYILPIGISFYTFMAIGYVIDVYNEDIKAEKNFGIVALFLSFFPLVLSGPIERATNMFEQFKSKMKFDYSLAVSGLQLMLWGYFMKLVVADRIAVYLGQTLGKLQEHSGPTLLLGTLLYPFQIYGDLGGYSLIAIGIANVMGFKVMHNFNRPFFATSMSAFWQRWHISLISWLTDYIYTPLSFSLRSYKIWGIVMALMLTFLISGAWHGAAITFIFWGFLQGTVLSIEALTKASKTTFENKYKLKTSKWYILVSCLFTYFLFAFSLLFGGAVNSLSKSFEVLQRIATNFDSIYFHNNTLIFVFGAVLILFLSELRDEFFPDKFQLYKNKNISIRWTSYVLTLLVIIFFGVFKGVKFIYFQF